jgi:prepilin-type N-terminal cleavage/methylation domain-containing protein
MTRCRGITLLEMMVVLAIVGVVLGIGAGMFITSRQDTGLRTGLHALQTMVRFAHAQSLVQRAPACIRIDTGDPKRQAPGVPPDVRIEVLLDRTFGLWHGEDVKTSGAYGFDGLPRGVTLEPGKIGMAFRFQGSGVVRVDGFRLPDAAEALTAEAWIYPVKIAGRQVILDKKGEVGLRIENAGTLAARVGNGRVDGRGFRVPLRQWSHVRVAAEEGTVTLYLNGLPIGEAGFNRLAKAADTPLSIGDGFRGLIDQVIIRGRVMEESVLLEPGLKVTCSGAVADPRRKGVSRILFTEEGRLDARFHSGPVTVTLEGGETKQAMTVGWMGTLQ